mmetsp:Transcript_85135/g.237588  ORF Transcript_85135/g.237588 Transcript_85135/m.237588 type:complete len:385 (+) Transcript_85135:87-1241(+)
MPSPPTVAAALTPEKVDSLLSKTEDSFADLGALRDGNANAEKLRDAEQELLKHFTEIRRVMHGLQREKSAGQTSSVQAIFGSGDRLARTRALLDATNWSEHNAGDPRWKSCLQACGEVERLLALPTPNGAAHATSEASPDGRQVGANAPPPSPNGRQVPELPHPSRELRPEQHIGNGTVYSGEWLGDLRDGEGVEVRRDGTTYRGQFEKGQAHGKGVYTQKDVTIVAIWSRGKLCGDGTETHKDGTRYEGQYEDGVKSGHGTYTFEEGSLYEGEFDNDRMHGQGVFVMASGSLGGRYEGQWRNNRMHGRGSFKHPDGRMYEGEYADDERNGAGTFSWPDGRKQAGMWKHGELQPKLSEGRKSRMPEESSQEDAERREEKGPRTT